MRVSGIAAAIGAVLWIAATGPLVAQTGGAANAENVPPEFSLRRVMLSTGGVGYFEYETEVAGDAALRFRVRRDQVDDVLKSVVVYDDQGRIGSISLPGQEPLRESFRGLPFEPSDLSSPVQLFNALRGAEIRVGGTREITGRLLSVTPERIEHRDGGAVTRHRISILSTTGIQQVVLEEAESLSFTSPELSAQLEAALAALDRHDDTDSRILTATLEGTDERAVRIAYVVGAPLWKSTYRLTLSSDAGGESVALQGWAVLENLSGEDWSDVELSVVSGNPVTFRQALYDAYYVDRPRVPVEVLGRVLPPADDGAMRLDAGVARPAGPAGRALDSVQEFAVTGARAAASLLAAESNEAATQVVFRVPRPVSVRAGESVLVPIVSQEVPARRLSLYQRGTHERHPLASVRLSNDTGFGLPPGVLTLYERDAADHGVSFVGDARLAAFPSGEERIVSFAVDQKVTVDHDQQRRRRLEQGRVVDGVLELRFLDTETTQYTIAGAAGEDRLVLLEHNRQPGWELAGTAQGIEITATAYRLGVDVPAGETVRVDVVLERPQLEHIALLHGELDRVELWVRSPQLSEETRGILAGLLERRQEISQLSASLQETERSRGTVISEQQRIRDNLQAVPANSDLSRRYLETLAEQEDRLAGLAQQIDTLRASLREAEERLAEYVRTLSL